MNDETRNEDAMDVAPRLELAAIELAPERQAALAAAIAARSAPVLARYRGARSPVAVLAAWLRPALAAAAVIVLVALAALLGSRPREATAVPSTAEALGFPGPVVAWAEAGRTPSLEELVTTLEVSR